MLKKHVPHRSPVVPHVPRYFLSGSNRRGGEVAEANGEMGGADGGWIGPFPADKVWGCRGGFDAGLESRGPRKGSQAGAWRARGKGKGAGRTPSLP
jgi:hypothetical protein